VPPKPKASARLPREQRRQQLIEAAAGAFLERGFDNTSMEDVARAAGVTRLIVYRIFESKQDLYRAVLDQLMAALAGSFGGLDVDEIRRRGAARVLLSVARRHPDAFRLLWRHALYEAEFLDVAVLFRTYVTNYARAILANFIIDDERRLEWAARSAGASLIESLCVWLDVGDPARDDEFGDRITAGLRALAGAWSRPPTVASPG
jgi:AcrR family transcriptional regulator